MNGSKVVLTDKNTGDKVCVEMANADTIKISYSDGREAYHKKTGELVSYSNGKPAPKMKSLQKKKIFYKEAFVFGVIIGAIILLIVVGLSLPDSAERPKINTHDAYSIMRAEVSSSPSSPSYGDIIFTETEDGYQLNTDDGFAVSVYYDSKDGNWKVHNFH